MDNFSQNLLLQLKSASLYFGLDPSVNNWKLWVVGMILLPSLFSLLAVMIGIWKKRKNRNRRNEPIKESITVETASSDTHTPLVSTAGPALGAPVITWQERLALALSHGRQEIWGKVEKLFGGEGLSSGQLEEMEELLYSADLGPKVVGELIPHLQRNVKSDHLKIEDLKALLRDFLYARMHPVQSMLRDELLVDQGANKGQLPKPLGIMIVGVNGAGKTTTIGKIATKLTAKGAKVVVGAGDTFRAAAVEQLQVWCERSGALMIRGKEGSRPSGVAFECLQQAIGQQADYCILDTAGRLHTNENLMDELKKIKGVWQKLLPGAPHHIYLVLDAITGQNAIRQAEEFHRALGLTGLIFTKCDGSSKAGSLVGIVEQLQVPAVFIGIGEKVDDLARFSLDDYLTALLS